MKSLSIYASLAFLLVTCFYGRLPAQGYPDIRLQTERILSYHSEITIDTTSKLSVTEKIKVNSLGQKIQRGIYRMLPLTRNVNGKSIFVKYDLISIKRDGKEEPYRTENSNSFSVTYIGDKDEQLAPGIYEYEIIYETRNQIGYFDEFDELYWNVSGSDWDFPIDEISAVVHLPDGAEILQTACYTGAVGSTDRNCTSTAHSDRIEWHAAQLGHHEGLTIGVGFTKGIVASPVIPSVLKTDNLIKIVGMLFVVLLLAMAFIWYKYGIDHEKPTVIPQFDVPENLSPASMGFLANGNYQHSLIAASLINLATKGYIRIIENPKKGLFGRLSFTLQKLNGGSGKPAPEENTLLSKLFSGGGETIDVKPEYNAKIARAVRDFTSKVTGRHNDLFTKGQNRGKVWLLFVFVSACYWGLVWYSYTHLYDYTRFTAAIILYVVVFLVFLGCTSVRLPSVSGWMWLIPAALTGGLGYLWKRFDGVVDPFIALFGFLLISLVALVIFSYLVRKPDSELLRVQSLIEGFKMYMGAAENQLIRFHNPPEMTPEIFEKYLPYALVLGVEAVWGKKFEKMIRDNAIPYQNHWYTGSMAYGLSSSLGSTLSSNLSSTISSAATNNSSSGSGSGGGGSSGGGGGGGGGGGW